MALQHPHLRVAHQRLTVAQINAGYTMIPAQKGSNIKVVDAWVRSTGTTTNCTSVDISDGTTVFIAFLAAALGDGVLARAGVANTTCTNLLTAAANNTGVKVISNGTESTATAYEVTVYYVLTSKAAA